MMIRIANELDIPAITKIYNEAIETTTATFDTEIKSEADRRSWLKNSHDERHPVWVSENSGSILGWSSLSKWSDRCAYADTAESSVYVYSSSRKMGMGQLLMVSLIDHAKKIKIHTILARISAESEPSIRLHEKLGFKKIGTMREVGKKFGRLHDVHIYQLML